jgi:ubiquinone/menaquinone biosynthesis C-methylase UbiE
VQTSKASELIEREFYHKKREIHCRDEEANAYDHQFSSLRNAREIAFILRNFKIKHSDLILEVGSGTGRHTVEFTKKAPKVVALDYSIESLKISKSQSKCQVVLADLCFLPFKASVFDKTAGISIFQHIPTMRSRIAGLKEIQRVTKEGGAFLIMVYNNRLWERVKGRPKCGYHRGLIYYHRFEILELKQILLSVFSKIVGINYLILEETPILSPLRFLYRIGLANIVFSTLDVLEKMPLFHLLLCDHILSICRI